MTALKRRGDRRLMGHRPGCGTRATALLLAGVTDWVVSPWLAHAHVQTTLDQYG
uniref:hypothetical protein n=1 Tax=Nonomuraea sp. CA-252377 TaxID=3240003 RepID=UPI003F499785